MSSWVFEARDRSGKPVRGTREASDRQAALDALRSEGLFLTRLEAARGAASPARPATPAGEVPASQSPLAGGVTPPRRVGAPRPTMPAAYVGSTTSRSGTLPQAGTVAAAPIPER